MRTIPINKAQSFFLDNGDYDFHRLWKPPTLYFPCKASNLWRACLVALENPERNNLLTAGPGGPLAEKKDVEDLGKRIFTRLEHVHGEIKDSHLGLVIATLTMSVLDKGLGASGGRLPDNRYRPNAHNAWSQILAGHLIALCASINRQKTWHAAPLAFYHMLGAVNQFEPLALAPVANDGVYSEIVRRFLQSSATGVPNVPPVIEPTIRIEGSPLFDYLVERAKWRRMGDSQPVSIAAPNSEPMKLLPKSWHQPPPAVWIGMCGSSLSGKTSIYTSLFNLNSYNPYLFQGMHLKSSREMAAMVQTLNVEPTVKTMFIGSGSLAVSGQNIYFADIKGGDLYEQDSASDIGKKALGRQANSPATGDEVSLGVRDVAEQSDLLVLTIGPDEIESEAKLRIVTDRLRGVIEASDRKHAMICVAFTKADDYGLAAPYRMQRLCFQNGLSRHGTPDDSWLEFLRYATPAQPGSPEQKVRDHLLTVVKQKLWNALLNNVVRGGAREKWIGPLGVYLLAPLPEDEAYGGKGDDFTHMRWHSLGVSTLFADFFRFYTPPSRIRPMKEILKNMVSGLSPEKKK